MKDLVTYLVKEITGSENFTVDETTDGSKVDLAVKADPEIMGIIIGKGGATVKAIRNIMRVKSTLDGTHFFLNVVEKE